VLAAILLVLVAKAFAADAAVVDGRSMLPLLRPGSVVLVLRCAYGLRLPGSGGYLLRWGEPRPGDVVVATSPRDGRPVVKRIASLAPEGAFVLLGDNSPESVDSREYGPVAFDALRGRVLLFGRGGRR
jgi:signal peptidase I